MKTTARTTPSAAAPQRHAGDLSPRGRRRRPESVKPAHDRAQQKAGAYKRIEIFLGLQAAIALRQLMRDGRTAREVIEALLREEKLRRQERAPGDTGRPP
jgi:hypothetical protein